MVRKSREIVETGSHRLQGVTLQKSTLSKWMQGRVPDRNFRLLRPFGHRTVRGDGHHALDVCRDTGIGSVYYDLDQASKDRNNVIIQKEFPRCWEGT